MQYFWEYGLTTAYGAQTPTRTVANNVTNQNANETISGLSANTIYHCRLVATNPAGTVRGNDQTFRTTTSGTTTLSAPTISGETATPYDTFAFVSLTLGTGGSDTTWWIEYSQGAAYQSYEEGDLGSFVGYMVSKNLQGTPSGVWVYGGSTGTATQIAGFLENGWKVKCIAKLSGIDFGPVGQVFTISGVDSYSATSFKLLRDDGSTFVPILAPAYYEFVLAGTVAGNEYVRGNVPEFVTNLPVQLRYTDGGAIPTNMLGQLYALSQVPSDGSRPVGYILVAASPGGSPILANATTFPADKNQRLILYNNAPPPLQSIHQTLSGATPSWGANLNIFGLIPSTLYTYHIRAQNSIGGVVSADHTFTSSAPLSWAAQSFEALTPGNITTVLLDDHSSDSMMGSGRIVLPQYNYSEKSFDAETVGAITAPSAGTTTGDTSTSTGRIV